MINLLKSKLRRKLLVHYFTKPWEEMYVRELARAIKVDPTNLLKELVKLEKEGLFVSFSRGNLRYFKLNKNYQLYDEFKNIVAKTAGIEGSLKNELKDLSGIELCFIYGSYANGKERSGSDIDLFLLGEKIDSDLLAQKIDRLEKRVDREISFRIFSLADFRKELKEKNSFILNILKNKKIFLIGDEKNIRKFN